MLKEKSSRQEAQRTLWQRFVRINWKNSIDSTELRKIDKEFAAVVGQMEKRAASSLLNRRRNVARRIVKISQQIPRYL